MEMLEDKTWTFLREVLFDIDDIYLCLKTTHCFSLCVPVFFFLNK